MCFKAAMNYAFVVVTSLICILVKGQEAKGPGPGDPCLGKNDVPGVWHGPDSYSNSFCCKEITVPKGYEVVNCSGDIVETGIKECRDGYYQERKLPSYHIRDLRCQEKRCKGGRVPELSTFKLKTEPAKCECNLTGGYFNGWGEAEKFNDDRQCQRNRCDAGKQLNKTGHCVGCPFGKFKNESSYLPCMDVTPCDDQRHTATTDTICGSNSTISRPTPSAPVKPPENSETPAKPVKTTPIAIVHMGVTEKPKSIVHTNKEASNSTLVITILALVVAVLVGLVVFGLFVGGLCATGKLRGAVACLKGQRSDTSSTAGLGSQDSSSGICSECSVKFQGEACEFLTKAGGPTEHVCMMEGDENEDAQIDNLAGKSPESSESAPLVVNVGATPYTPEPEESRDDSHTESGDMVGALPRRAPQEQTTLHAYQQQVSKDSALGSMNGSLNDSNEECVEFEQVQGEGNEEKNDALVAPPLTPPMTSAPPPYTSLPESPPPSTSAGPQSIIQKNYININIGNIHGGTNSIGQLSIEGSVPGVTQVHKIVTSPSSPTTSTTPPGNTTASRDADETEPKTVPPYPASTPVGKYKIAV